MCRFTLEIGIAPFKKSRFETDAWGNSEMGYSD